MAYRTENAAGTVSSIDDAYSAMESLRDECQEIVDNAQDSNLSQTSRIQTLEETCGVLDSCCDAPSVPDIVAELSINYSVYKNKDKRRGVSRSVQRDEAIGIIDQAIGACQEWLDDESNTDEDQRSEVEAFIDQLESDKGEWEGVDFPGMMG